MEAVILAGGLGTRLRSLVADQPKSLADIGGRPFLDYLIAGLQREGIERIVVCVGHLGEQIERHLGDGSSLGVAIRYSREMEPLGTGGALRLALTLLEDETVLVTNGDSFLDFSLRDMLGLHRSRGAQVTMALSRQVARGRYGAVEVDAQGLVTAFREKPEASDAVLINAGVYLMERSAIEEIAPDRPTSLEREVLPRLVGRSLFGAPFPGYFTDIGVPADLLAVRSDPGRLRSIHPKGS